MIVDHWLGSLQDGEPHEFWLGMNDFISEGIMQDYLFSKSIQTNANVKVHLSGTTVLSLLITPIGLKANLVMEDGKRKLKTVRSWILQGGMDCGMTFGVILMHLPSVNLCLR